MLNQIVKNNLPKESIVKLSGNLDYNRAIEIIQIIESMKNCNIKYEVDWFDTNYILMRKLLKHITLQKFSKVFLKNRVTGR